MRTEPIRINRKSEVRMEQLKRNLKTLVRGNETGTEIESAGKKERKLS